MNSIKRFKTCLLSIFLIFAMASCEQNHHNSKTQTNEEIHSLYLSLNYDFGTCVSGKVTPY